MLKSVNVYFNPNIPTFEKLDKIKELGYDEYFTGIDRGPETVSMKKELEYAKKLGLKATMIHCKYDGKILDNFWKSNIIGTYIRLYYSFQMRKAKGYTSNFVVHLHGSKNAVTSDIGIKRIKKLLKVAHKCNLNLCIENLFSYDEIPYVFSNISDERLKICFDVGHRNCLTPSFDVLSNYGNFVSVLHIHDNNSKSDEHKILGNGSIDINEFANGLAQYPNLVLSSEVKQKDDSNYIDYLTSNYIALNNLNSLVNKDTEIQ